MDTNPSPLNKTEASCTHDSAPCFIHHPQGAQSSPPCPPDTCSFRIPGPRLPVCPSSLTALWSADNGELQGSVLRNMLFSTYIQSVKSSTILRCYPGMLSPSGFFQMQPLSLKPSLSTALSQKCQPALPVSSRLLCFVRNTKQTSNTLY